MNSGSDTGTGYRSIYLYGETKKKTMSREAEIQKRQDSRLVRQTPQQASLTRIEKSVPVLTSEQVSVVKAYQTGTKLKTASKTQLGDLWDRLIFMLGIRITQASKKDFDEDMDLLTVYILQEFPERTLEEIELAYRMLLRGELGIEAYPILNPNQFSRVVNRYVEKTQDEYNDALDMIDASNEEPTPQPTAEELETLFQQTYQKALAMARKLETFDDYGNYLFDELDKRGLIDFTAEEETEIFKQAREDLIKEKEAQKQAATAPNKLEIEKLIMAIEERSFIGSAPIMTKAKRIALQWYLARLIEKE